MLGFDEEHRGCILLGSWRGNMNSQAQVWSRERGCGMILQPLLSLAGDGGLGAAGEGSLRRVPTLRDGKPCWKQHLGPAVTVHLWG